VIHLGMSGRVLIEAHESRDQPGAFHHETGRLPQHDHVEIALEGGKRIIFNDPRRFGFMLLEPSETLEKHPAFEGLGVEPLGNAFSAAHLLARFAGRRTPLKLALLDQRHVAGLGNIYVCEALHRAGLAPKRPAGQLSPNEAERLAAEIRVVLEEAIAAGGSTLKDYRHEDGSLGYFQHAFRVYDREGEPCPTPGCGGTISRLVQGGRSTFFCEECQR
jgi:formamidopyrimidine-DNA glycosylase